MEARYRRDYPGEFVILNTIWSGGKRVQQREWVANPIENQHISGRATCIGSRDSLVNGNFDYRILQRHRGGLLGTLKLQNYGTGAIAEEMRLDFAVELDQDELEKLKLGPHFNDTVIYTTAKNCIASPGDFYLIPLNPKISLPALPVYLAAFDGHSEVFLLGYSRQTDHGYDRWLEDCKNIFDAYDGVTFWVVGEPSIAPEMWLDCANVKTMGYRDFISYADV